MANRLTTPERLQRAQSLSIEVDQQDKWLLSALTWRISQGGHVVSTIYAGPRILNVKLIDCIMGSPISTDELVIHDDRNKLNNRRHNLRWIEIHVSSDYRDYVDKAQLIYYRKKTDKFECRIKRNGVEHYIGGFSTLELAERARDQYLREVNQSKDGNA